VSPSKGALFMMSSLFTETFAPGKFLNKLKSTSANDILASTFSLIASNTFAFI